MSQVASPRASVATVEKSADGSAPGVAAARSGADERAARGSDIPLEASAAARRGSLRLVEIAERDRAAYAEALERDMLEDVARRGLVPAAPEFFDAAEIAEGVLPAQARAGLAALRRGSADALVIRGLATDDVVAATPCQLGERTGLPRRGSAWIAACIRRLGHEMAYALEKSGALVQDIHPTREGAESQSNASWKVGLSLHTENAFHTIRPDYVVLYCVRAPANPPATRLAFLDDVLAGVTDADTAVLREQRFTIRVVDSFRAGGERDMALPARPVGGSLRRPTVRWHESLRATDDTAARVAESFARAAGEAAQDVRLEPGDLLAFSNDRCLHGRDRFEAQLDGTDRWLLRAYALRDMSRTSSFVAPARPSVLQLDLATVAGG